MRFSSLKKLTLAAFTACLVITVAPNVFAQEEQVPPEQQMPPQPEAVDPATITDEQIEATAQAFVAVADIRSEYEASLGEINTPEEAQQLQMEVEERMVSAIEEQGLTSEQYNGIVMAANQDEELYEKLVDEITRLQEGG